MRVNPARHLALGLALMAGLAACGPAGPAGAPDTLVANARGEAPVPYAAIATTALPLDPATQPAAWEFIEPRPKCAIPRPSPLARIVYTYSYGGGDHTPAQFVEGRDSAQILAIRAAREAARTEDVRDAAVLRTAAAVMTSNAINWTDRVDVLVTETEQPVFLYLASYNAVLWNIQLAPGARIDGIVVNAYEGGIIANGVSPSRTAILSQQSMSGQRCFTSGEGFAVTVEERIAGAKALNPDFDASRYRQEWKEEARGNEEYHRRILPGILGRKVDLYVMPVAGSAFSAMLVGPVPAQPFVPQPVTRLQVSAIAQPFWGSREGAFRAFGAKG